MKKRLLGNLLELNLDKSITSHYGPVLSVDWNITDNIIASSSSLGDIILYNVETDINLGNLNNKTS